MEEENASEEVTNALHLEQMWNQTALSSEEMDDSEDFADEPEEVTNALHPEQMWNQMALPLEEVGDSEDFANEAEEIKASRQARVLRQMNQSADAVRYTPASE